MDFDFHKTYAAYSIEQLLLILAEPHKYQPAAVKAAQDILATKDIEAVQQAQSLAASQGQQPISVKQAAIKEASIFDEEEDVKLALVQTRLWFAVVVILGVLQTYRVYRIAIGIWYIRNPSFLFDSAGAVAGTAFKMAIIIALVLFIQKKSSGWLLLMPLVVFELCSYIFWLFVGAYMSAQREVTVVLLMILLYGLVAGLLYRPVLRSQYEVDQTTAQKLILLGIGLALVINIGLLWSLE